MKTVLVIAYNFPPMGGAGVQRTLKFVKYLPTYGYRPVVVSVDPRYVRKAQDRSLLREIPPDVPVYRTPTFDIDYFYKLLYGVRAFRAVEWLNRRVFVPDIQAVWNRFARPVLERVVAKEKPDLVYVSGAPFSSFQLGEFLKARHGLPLVLDFRDEWTTNPVERRNLALSPRERNLERWAVHAADGLVLLSPLMREHLLSVYPELADKPCAIIPNGYDESDFAGLASVPATSGPMRLVFTGTLYGRFITTFRHAVAGIASAMTAGSIPQDGLVLDVYGKNTPHTVLPDAPAFVRFHGYLSHRESIRNLLSADALLLPVGCAPELASHYSGKLFEYLRAGRPILALVPPSGEAAEVLRATATGTMAPDETPETLAQMFAQAYSIHKERKVEFRPDHEAIRRYERRELTGRLAALYRDILPRSEA